MEAKVTALHCQKASFQRSSSPGSATCCVDRCGWKKNKWLHLAPLHLLHTPFANVEKRQEEGKHWAYKAHKKTEWEWGSNRRRSSCSSSCPFASATTNTRACALASSDLKILKSIIRQRQQQAQVAFVACPLLAYLLVLLSADDDGVMLLHEGGKQRWRQDERERERSVRVGGGKL